MTKKVLLIYPPVNSLLGFKGVKNNFFIDRQLGLGLLYLASFLENKGVEVSLLDMSLYTNPEKQLISVLQKYTFDFIGITSLTNTINTANDMAGLIKKFSKAKIIIGGIHASALPEETLDIFKNFDYLVYGEGEETLAEIAFNDVISDIQGLVWRENNRIIKNPARNPIQDLNKLPFPARHSLDFKKYIPGLSNYRSLPTTGILSSRGCPFQCTFCSRAGTRFSKQVIYRSIDNIIDEIIHCIEKYNIYDFRFYDDIFVIPKNRLIQFCNELIRKKMKISWNCYSRVDTIDKEMLQIMKKTGCYHIKYGVDFGTEKWLEKTKKGTTLEQAKETVNITKKAGILAKVDLIIGMPEETIEEIKEAINFAKDLNATYTTFNIFTPLPGSEIFNELKINKKLYPRGYEIYSCDKKEKLFNSQLDFAILESLISYGYKKIYFNFRFIRDIIIHLFKNFSFSEIKTFITGFFILLTTLFKNTLTHEKR